MTVTGFPGGVIFAEGKERVSSFFPISCKAHGEGPGAWGNDGEEPLHRNAFVSLPRTVSVFLQR